VWRGSHRLDVRRSLRVNYPPASRACVAISEWPLPIGGCPINHHSAERRMDTAFAPSEPRVT
jgi:hypothetical protein